MPQFDISLYFSIFIIFLSSFYIFYVFLSIHIIPFFWNIYYFRYLKKENNKQYKFLNIFLYKIKKKQLNIIFNDYLFLFYCFFFSNNILNSKNMYLYILKEFLIKLKIK